LDWIKLPAYETAVIRGRSRGIPGRSNYADGDLGELRAQTLAHLITLYRPRLVLCDHAPQGKHKELGLALEASKDLDTQWVLGVRGVVGSVPQVQSDLARKLFQKHYRTILWYGDSAVLGDSHRRQLKSDFGVESLETGYVCRLAEVVAAFQGHRQGAAKPSPAGTVSIPWMGEKTLEMMVNLATALTAIGPGHGHWHLYLGADGDTRVKAKIDQLFCPLSHCLVRSPGPEYIRSLNHSKTALIFGGYNSLVDVLYTGLPAVVMLRAMQDAEQQIHVDNLLQATAGSLVVLDEEKSDAPAIQAALQSQLDRQAPLVHDINLAGAENASRHLAQLMQG
jgi:predicted glycosyltransferase